MNPTEAIKRLEQIKTVLEKNMEQAGYFAIQLKDGSYLNFLGTNVIISTLNGQIFIKQKDDKGYPISEAFIKPNSIKGIWPKEVVLPKVRKNE